MNEDYSTLNGMNIGRGVSHRLIPKWSLLPAALVLALAFGMTGPGRAEAARLSVTPKTVKVGQKRCFTFTATSSGRRLKGKPVMFARQKAFTGPKGRARICGRLRWTGRHGALLALRGKRRDWVMVRAKANKGVTTIGGEFHKIVVNVQGWSYSVQPFCEKFTAWAESDNRCWGLVQGAGTWPFEIDNPASFRWETQADTSIRVAMSAVVGTDRYGKDIENGLFGFVASPRSGAYYVRGGDYSYRWIRDVFGSGTDPTREGLEGGPLHIDVISHSKLKQPAFNFYVAGYIFY